MSIIDGSAEYELKTMPSTKNLDGFIDDRLSAVGNHIRLTSDNDYFYILGGATSHANPQLTLRANNANITNPGSFSLETFGTSTHTLLGTTDGKLTWDNKNILNSSNIKVSAQHLLHTLDDNYITICGGTTTNTSSYLQTYGKDHINHPGHFQLVAKNATQGHSLIGTPQGELTWRNHDLAGAAIVEKSFNISSSYIKYTSGLVIQWGDYTPLESASKFTITFPISFTDYNTYSPFVSYWDSATSSISINNCFKTSFQVIYPNAVTNNHTKWFAIGY